MLLSVVGADLSIKSQVDNGSQCSGNSQAKPLSEGVGVDNSVTSATKGMSISSCHMLVSRFIILKWYSKITIYPPPPKNCLYHYTLPPDSMQY